MKNNIKCVILAVLIGVLIGKYIFNQYKEDSIKTISNNVNYLINNDITSTSTKNMKAKELGISIISENDLLNMGNESKGE